MGIPRKGAKRITVDGVEYRYLIKETYAFNEPKYKRLSVTVQESIEKPGNVVQFRAGYGCAILKPDMVLNIRKAINRGWDPAKRGGAFIINTWEWAKIKDREEIPNPATNFYV